jgi:hypothetical protein
MKGEDQQQTRSPFSNGKFGKTPKALKSMLLAGPQSRELTIFTVGVDGRRSILAE